MPVDESSDNPQIPALRGTAGADPKDGTFGVGVFGCVGLPDPGLPGAPPLNKVGVYGSTIAVDTGIGVYGVSPQGTGVYGVSTGGTGVHGMSTSNVGVKGESEEYDGVQGWCKSNGHAAVSATHTTGGPAVWGRGKTTAGRFDGDVEINGNLLGNCHVTGNLQVDGQQNVMTGNLQVQGDHYCSGTVHAKTDVVLGEDCAEDFDVDPSTSIEPGTVMVLGNDGHLQACQNSYDRRVAGIVSGAGDYKPGLILGRRVSSQDRVPVALVGKVYCKADAEYGAIAVGDLLTTSPTPGHAMRAAEPSKAFGAIIGKALRPLDVGRGLVAVLVSLQ